MVQGRRDRGVVFEVVGLAGADRDVGLVLSV